MITPINQLIKPTSTQATYQLHSYLLGNTICTPVAIEEYRTKERVSWFSRLSCMWDILDTVNLTEPQSYLSLYCIMPDMSHYIDTLYFKLYRKHDVTNPCSHCPLNKKHQILRLKFFNRYPLYPAYEKALINGLDSRKNIPSLVPSLENLKKKGRVRSSEE